MLLLLTPELQKKSFTVGVAEKVRLPVNAVMRDRSRTIVTNSIADGERASGSINDKTKASHVKRKHRKKMCARCAVYDTASWLRAAAPSSARRACRPLCNPLQRLSGKEHRRQVTFREYIYCLAASMLLLNSKISKQGGSSTFGGMLMLSSSRSAIES